VELTLFDNNVVGLPKLYDEAIAKPRRIPRSSSSRTTTSIYAIFLVSASIRVAECVLDGLLLAARSETLLSNQLTFDERFDFHFYNMDFCRQAEEKI
jgi:hypothetical protein